ncbi:hypothetical protein ACQ1ZO_16875, partial [Enterococcus faecalis]|uniref:hypothetical protein n=1 Tax=Enterococcus faecalis TaxID=1351 RepID=UPI003D6BE736
SIGFVDGTGNLGLADVGLGRSWQQVPPLANNVRSCAGVLPVPELTGGCLRVTFFFSFLGLIVSVLGFALSVPLLASD